MPMQLQTAAWQSSREYRFSYFMYELKRRLPLVCLETTVEVGFLHLKTRGHVARARVLVAALPKAHNRTKQNLGEIIWAHLASQFTRKPAIRHGERWLWTCFIYVDATPCDRPAVSYLNVLD